MYTLFYDNAALKFIKKADRKLKENVESILNGLKENPYIGEELKGDKKGIYSYHFFHLSTSYRIAYTINETKIEILIILINTRENFYKELSRLI